MRVLKELSIQGCKVTLYLWNNRYLIKMEQGYLEQTFKVDQFEFDDDSSVLRLLDERFVEEALGRFDDMGHSLHAALQRVNEPDGDG
ncbi:MAG: hypothetical protein DIU61_006790 [Bacteroidota bacterium]|nr:MAG: hypothetical protein DIU61_18065 [Bacteroidota bacterium]